MSLLLNRKSASHVVRFFQLCFKQGVIDAYELGDDLVAKEFYEQKREDWSFGILGEPDDFDWQAFRYKAYWWARKGHMKTLAENYLFRIRTTNYVWCVLPYCMRFYLMGISEWLAYPNPSGIELFKSTPNVHWNPNEQIRNISKADIFSYLHDFEYEYRRFAGDSKRFTANSMSSFVRALFDLTRKYVVRDEDEEDLEADA